MTIAEAETKISKKVSRFWIDRALEIFQHMTMSNTIHTTVSRLRISADWPVKGKITFTRDTDGARIQIYMNKRGFQANRTN